MSGARLALSAGVASVGVALVLIGLKAWALAATGSLAVGASLADSLLDLVASAAGLAAIWYASRPADEDHRFGHSSAEDLAALVQAVLVLAAAGMIALKGAERLMAPAPLAREEAGMAVMAVSVLLTGALVLWQGHVARRTGSPVVAADRMHYIADLLPNLGAFAALGAARFLGVLWLDVAVAFVAAAVLAWGSLRILRRAFDALMDREAEPGLVARVEEVARGVEGIRGVHDIRSRRAGRQVFIQIHAEIDGALTLRAAHATGERLRRAVCGAFPGAEVIIHKDPV